ncbi:TPD1 protein-like 1 [Vitis vinifera]|uniref:TPD1 protein-like 1 n=1 Tax=Vitis vinifera TaxID=29760 RepID=A0A438HHW5_VITVI|nr:TPD1 protein-like 1 [Vitis vinifera]
MKVFSICPVSIVMLSIIIISTNLMIPFYTVVAAETNCSNGDIVIAQSRVGTLPSGIPSFSVEITNACARGCSISNLHLKCGMFASAGLVNPKIFKRQDVDDCLVNGGSPLAAGSTISFKYANTFQYPLSLASATCG